VQGDILSAEEWAAVEEMGILVDQDDQGVLLQIFTKPLGDRCAAYMLSRICAVRGD
jgi:4-hydroxyphenylpyruvate dioxygenase